MLAILVGIHGVIVMGTRLSRTPCRRLGMRRNRGVCHINVNKSQLKRSGYKGDEVPGLGNGNPGRRRGRC